MTKKFISLLIAVIMVVGLLPVMSVSAAGETIYLEDDFQDYDIGVYSNGDSPLSVNGVEKWTINKSTKVEVVNINDANGNPTKALKYCNTFGRYQQITDKDGGQNQFRFTAKKTNSSAPSLTALAGNVFVQEIDIWLPANIENKDGSIDRKRPGKFSFGSVVGLKGDSLEIGGSNVSVAIASEKWYNIKVALDYTNYKASGDLITCTVYVNNEAIHHGTLSTGYAKPSTSMGYYIMLASQLYSSYEDAAGNWEDIYVVFDNLKMYVNPGKTEASSTFSDATSIPVNANVTVDFSDMVVDIPDATPATISKDNVKITKADGTEVDLTGVTLGADKKSIVIEPAADLEKGVEYNVTVTGIKDRYGRVVDTYSFSFTTAADANLAISVPKFSAVDFASGSIEEIKAIKEGFVSASYTVLNNASSPKSVVMLAVLKNNDTIEQFQIKNVTIGANCEVSFNGAFNIENPETHKMEVYIWDDMCNMTPLAAKYAIDANGITVIPNN